MPATLKARWSRLALVAVAGLGLGAAVTVGLPLVLGSPTSVPPAVKALRASYRLDHLVRRPDPTDADRAEDAALWDAAEAQGYHQAEDSGLDDAKSCQPEPAAFHSGCVEWVAEQSEEARAAGPR